MLAFRTMLPARCAAAAMAAPLALLTTATASAGIHLDIVASPAPARQGDVVDVEITVTNDDAFARTDVSVILAYPAGLDSFYDTNSECQCPSTTCDPGEDAVFTIPTLGAGKGMTYSLAARVAAAQPDGAIIPLAARALDDAVELATANTTIVVDGSRTLDLALTESSDPVTPGAYVDYTMVYGLRATAAGEAGVVLSLPLPDGMTLVAASPGGKLNGDAVEWPLGNLNPGATGEHWARFMLDAALPIGTVTSAEARLETGDGDVVTYRSSARIQDDIPLQFLVTAGPNPARTDETIDLELAIVNRSAFERTDVSVILEIPQLMASVYDTLFDGDCPSTTCDPTELARFTVGTLPAGKGLTYSVPARIATSVVDGTVVNFEAYLSDGQGDRRESATSIAVSDPRAFNLALSEAHDPLPSSGRVELTLTWGLSQAAVGAPGARLRLPLPDGTTFVGASHDGALADGVVAWSLGDLNPGTAGTRTVTLDVDPGVDAGSILRASALVTDALATPRITHAGGSVRVEPPLPLQVRVSATPTTARPGEVMDVEITVTNTDAFDRTGVTLSMEVPDLVASFYDTLTDGDCPSTTCDPTENQFFDLGTIAAGAGRTFTVPMYAAAATPSGSVIRVEAQARDNTGAQARSASAFAIDANREYDLALVESDEPIVTGGSITYTVTGGTMATGNGVVDGRLRFFPPAGTAVIGQSDGGAMVDGAVEWGLGALNPGVGRSRRVTVALDGDVVAGAVLAATATFSDAASPIAESRFEDTTRIAGAAPLDVELTVAQNAVAPGAPFHLDLSVKNTTAFDRANVTMYLEWPDGVASEYDSTFGGDCPSTTCDPQERATFVIPVLAAGETISFPVNPTVADATPIGTVINFDALAIDGLGAHAADGDALYVGTSFIPARNGDINDDGRVDVADLLGLLAAWGPCGDPDTCAADFTGDGAVDVSELLVLLANWG